MLSQNETSVCKAVINEWFLRFGVPEQIISDNGAVFTGKAFKSLCNRRGILTTTCSPYVHHTTGLIERQFRTLREMMRATSWPTTMPWEQRLREVEFTLNSSKQATTGVSPLFIIQGQSASRSILQSDEDAKRRLPISNTIRQFAVGDRVLVRQHLRTKSEPVYVGPKTIINLLGPRRVVLEDGSQRRIEWLCAYHPRGAS